MKAYVIMLLCRACLQLMPSLMSLMGRAKVVMGPARVALGVRAFVLQGVAV
jgi:hypothetical protein